MEKLFEKAMQMETADAFDKILKTQTETYGAYEIEQLSHIIDQNEVKTVLDIGTGEGSFLFNLAKRQPDVNFVAIDHNDDFLRRAFKLKDEMALQNVRLEKAFFDCNYDFAKFDMIFARFTLQHASNPQDFLDEVFKRLTDKGIFITIDEYLFRTEIKNPVWNEFYDCWIKCFKKAGCNHLMLREINPWLKKAGFKDIKNSIQLYSPITIGSDNFKILVTRIAALLYKVYPDIWSESFFPTFEKWLGKVVVSNEVDPFIPMARVVAKK